MTIFTLISNTKYQHKNALYKIISHVCKIKKDDMIKHYDDVLSQDQINQIISMYDRYTIDKEPLEFVFGYVEFFQRKFKVDSRCLIPRAETEYMIQAVCEYVNLIWSPDTDKKRILFDIWTWCGVLGLSVLLENPKYFDLAILTEYDDGAFELAKENYLSYRSKIESETHILKSDLMDFIRWRSDTHTVSFPNLSDDSDIVLVANLPYIPDDTFEQNADESAKKREPIVAFLWWKDGLDLYRKMFEQLFDYNIWAMMFLEMMTWQVEILEKEYGDKIKFDIVKTFHFNIVIVKGELVS